MTELRRKIADRIGAEVLAGDEDHWASRECHEAAADRILAIPEIAKALKCLD